MEAMHLLAGLHKDLEFIPTFPEMEGIPTPVIRRFLPSREYEKHNKRIEEGPEILKTAEPEDLVRDPAGCRDGSFLEEAGQICEEWKR